MNSTITEMKNILEGTNSRIIKAEEWLSEKNCRMVEITEAEQNKENRIKRIEKVSQTLGTTLNKLIFKL